MPDARKLKGTDYFPHHLAQLNDKMSVVASDDILNVQGALIIAKGTPISASRAQLIAKHKLVKPLEQSVALEKTYDPEQLYQALLQMGVNWPGLATVIKGDALQVLLQRCCKRYGKYPLMRQQLSVLAHQLPVLYHYALFSALACTALAHRLEQTDDACEQVFFAALMHDIGLLHLDPDLVMDSLNHRRRLTPEQTRILHGHAAIAKHLLDLLPGLPKGVGEAVLDHHERTDGSGYPLGKTDKQLSLNSQIIALVDSIIDNQRRYAIYGSHTHQLLLEIIRLKDDVHFSDVGRAAVLMLSEDVAPKGPPLTGPTANDLLARLPPLQKRFAIINQLTDKLQQLPGAQSSRVVSRLLAQIDKAITRAGLDSQWQREWLVDISQQDESEHRFEVLKVSVMYDEIENRIDLLSQHLWQHGQRLAPSNPGYSQLLFTAHQLLRPDPVEQSKSVALDDH